MMPTNDTAARVGHGPDDPLTPEERVELLAWARGHPDWSNHVAAVFVIRYERVLAAAEQERDERASVAQSWRNQYDALKAEVERLGALLNAAEQARDAAQVEARQLRQVNLDFVRRLARLAALEQAARAVAQQDSVLNLRALRAAIAALDAPPADDHDHPAPHELEGLPASSYERSHAPPA